MTRKLIRSLSKVAGLGWLRRFDAERPETARQGKNREVESREPAPNADSEPVPAELSPGAQERPQARPDRTRADESLGLAAVEPGRAFAFWAVAADSIARACEHLDEPAARVILRIYDVTGIDFNGSNERRAMDVLVEEDRVVKGNRYLELWTTDQSAPRTSRIYCELGVRGAAGDFVAVAWSPVLDLPTGEEPSAEEHVRGRVNGGSRERWRPRVETPQPVPSATPFEDEAAARSGADGDERLEEFAPGTSPEDAGSYADGSPRPVTDRALTALSRDVLRSAVGVSSGSPNKTPRGHRGVVGVSSGSLTRWHSTAPR